MTAVFSRDFAHLHVRSGFSYGYGTATPEELAGAATCMNMDALALTDRDGPYGIPRLLKVAERTLESVGASQPLGIVPRGSCDDLVKENHRREVC